MPINRRDFIKIFGSGTLFSLLLPLLPKEAIAEIERGLSYGLESVVVSVCQQCPQGCGILVRCVDGWPVKIEGSPLHPVNRGTLCPLGFAGIFTFYDPDRIRTPLKRVGPKGSNQWEAVSWEDAIKEVAAKLSGLRQNNQAHQLVIMDGEHRGLMRVLFEHFSAAFATPNYVPANFSSLQGPVEAMSITQGLNREPSYDIANAGTLFLFGADILEASSSPAGYSRAWGKMRRGEKGRRGKVIYIGPRLSVTASKADEWVQVNPGTDGTLALGLAHVLIKESLIDSQFVDNNCSNFYDGLRPFILSEFEPNIVSEKTGVDVPAIFRLAREFVRQRPSVAVAGCYRSSDQAAVHSLNALAGSINVPGGVLMPREVDYGSWDIENAATQEALVSDKKASDLCPELIAKFFSGEPYKTTALFLYYTNPVFSRADGDKFKEAITQIPYVVSFSPFMDETTSLADMILPDQTFLERWQDVPASTLDGFPVLGISQPIKKTLYNTRHTGDVLLDLASGLGLKLPWPNFQALLDDGLKRIFDLNKGDVFGDETETSWMKLLERSGWWAPAYETFDQFKELIFKRGGWWDPSYHFSEWSRAVVTSSGKFEFDSNFKEAVQDHDTEYPLRLELFRVLPWLKSRTCNQPWLTEIAGQHLFERWRTWVEINPQTAVGLKISDGDKVWVKTRRGKIKAVARIYEGILPDVAAIPIGLGHSAGGRYIQGLGSNPLTIVEDGISMARIEKYA